MEQLFYKLYEIYNEGKKDDGLIDNLRKSIGDLTTDEAVAFGEFIIKRHKSKQMPAFTKFLEFHREWSKSKSLLQQDSGGVCNFTKYCRSAAAHVRATGGVANVVYKNTPKHRAWRRYFEFNNFPDFALKLEKMGVPTDYPYQFDAGWSMHRDKVFADMPKGVILKVNSDEILEVENA